MYRLLLLLLGVSLNTGNLFAQELNADVVVSYENIKQTDPNTFKTLEENIRQFLNETNWTRDKFETEERIDCSFYLNITNEIDINKFSATATIKSSRPVYNSTYNTVILDVIDKDFEFEFDPYTVFEYRENDFANNLTSSLAFYAYTIIGLDYDSFTSNGGKTYHDKAQTIVQNATSSPFPGWTQSKTNNSGDVSKFWISNNLTDPKFNIVKFQFYEYHRNGLDQLYDNPKTTWDTVLKVLTSYERVYKQNRNLPLMYLFFTAKSQEIVDIMSQAQLNQKQKVSEVCQTMDPINTKLYKTLLK